MDAQWIENVENRGVDRIIGLTPIPGKTTTTDKGLTDNRLFTGENKLHAVLEPDGCLWSLKYDSGTLPGALKQRFTGYTKLLTFVTEYFARRNIIAKEIR